MLSFLLGLSFYAQAQVGKGFYTGSGIQMGYSSTLVPGYTQKTLEFGISPKFGYFFSNHWAIGMSGNFSFSKTGNLKINNFNYSVFSRYAHPIALEGKLMLWADLSAGLKPWKSWGIVQYQSRGINFETSISAGLLLFPKPKIGIELALGNIFSYTKMLNLNGTPYDLQTIGVLNIGNTSPQVGLYYFFNR
jgi:hypothetical protein